MLKKIAEWFKELFLGSEQKQPVPRIFKVREIVYFQKTKHIVISNRMWADDPWSQRVGIVGLDSGLETTVHNFDLKPVVKAKALIGVRDEYK